MIQNGLRIFLAFWSCLEPCTEVSYNVDVDQFFIESDEQEFHTKGRCDKDSSIVSLQFSRIVEREVVKSVHLILFIIKTTFRVLVSYYLYGAFFMNKNQIHRL